MQRHELEQRREQAIFMPKPKPIMEAVPDLSPSTTNSDSSSASSSQFLPHDSTTQAVETLHHGPSNRYSLHPNTMQVGNGIASNPRVYHPDLPPSEPEPPTPWVKKPMFGLGRVLALKASLVHLHLSLLIISLNTPLISKYHKRLIP